MEEIPTWKAHTNWKINAFPKNMQEVSYITWFLELLIIIYEQTSDFKVRNKNKINVTYKAEGYVFQMDVIHD